jgi:flagellar M-ring protein FliF
MDFLNQAMAQARELFGSMTVGARITAGLLLAVLVVSLAFLFNRQAGGADDYLMNGEAFSASELPAMQAAFAKAGLTDFEVVGGRIRIPSGKDAAYMGALADAGALPPSFNSYLEKALSSDSIFMSSEDKRTRLKVAKQNELALILRSMQGIENASVIYDVQKGTGLDRRETITATVSVKPLGNQPLAPSRVPAIRNLVAGAIAGLDPSGVTVADLNGRTYPGGEDGLSGYLEDPYYARKSMYEKRLEAKIGDTLSYVPGVVVQVSAVLDKELRHIEKELSYDSKTVVSYSRERTTSDRTEGTSGGGQPGLAAQGPSAGPAAVANTRTTSNNSEDIESETQNLVPTIERQVEKKTLTPERVNVTVVVPSDYYEQVWNERNPAADGGEPPTPQTQDLDKIKATVTQESLNAVEALLPPLPAGENPFPQVTVTTFQSLTKSPLAAPSPLVGVGDWLGENWSTLALCGLVLCGLMMLRSMVKSAPQAAPAAEPPNLGIVAEDAENEGEGETRKLKRRLSRGPSLKDELAELVREDPDAAASILRNWISNAS